MLKIVRNTEKNSKSSFKHIQKMKRIYCNLIYCNVILNICNKTLATWHPSASQSPTTFIVFLLNFPFLESLWQQQSRCIHSFRHSFLFTKSLFIISLNISQTIFQILLIDCTLDWLYLYVSSIWDHES